MIPDSSPLTPREELELLRLRKEERYLRDFVEPLKEVEAMEVTDEMRRAGVSVLYREFGAFIPDWVREEELVDAIFQAMLSFSPQVKEQTFCHGDSPAEKEHQ